MSAKIIIICNQKGGSGKTTLAMQLGGALALKNYKVLIIDGDEQGSAMEWASLASEENPFPAQVCSLAQAGKRIPHEIKRFYPNYDYIIVDCPPAAESNIAKSSLIIADLAIVPFIPGPLDMLAATKIRDLIEDAKILNPSLKSRILINRLEPQTTLSKTIMDMMTKFNIELMTNKLHKRTHYGQSVLSGSTVHKFKSAKEAIREIEAVLQEVMTILQ